MPGFTYQGFQNPFAGTIGELMQRGPAAQAAAVQQIGEARARAAEASGHAWAGAAHDIGQTVAGSLRDLMDPRRQLEAQQLEIGKLRLGEAQALQAGQGQVDTMMRGDQLPAGEAGPRAPSYLDERGLFKIPEMSAALAASGRAHLAPELLKGAEQINQSITEHQAQTQKLGQTQALLVGDLADGALKLGKIGMPLLSAMDFVVQPALATKSIDPQQYARIRQQIEALPPDQQEAALNTFRDAAAKLDKGDTLAEGAKHIDRYGRTEAANAPKVPLPTRASLAATANDPTKTPAERDTAAKALAALTPTPKRTDAELALDAYAVSIGKTKAEDLTHGDRLVYERERAKFTSDTQFQQHMRERAYDNAHPAPVKADDQNKLEQEYRTVLARGLSSRSGGLGLEDSKVQQANHLIALLDAGYDPTTGAYNIPRVQQTELAMGLAKLVSPGGVVAQKTVDDINQATAKGDLAKALTYVTGTPFNGTTQDLVKMYRDSIIRQGEVAQTNREGEMAYLRGLAPTTLAEDRRKKLEATSLNPLRQSRVIQNTATGERKLQVSTDGGATWK
jgi:hypothetical protein